MKGVEVEKTVETLIDLPVSAFIPEQYIKVHSQRISAYKRIAAIENDEDLMDAYDELLDIYGDVPMVVNNLMEVALIKKLASEKKFTEIKGSQKSVDLFFDPDNAPDFTELITLMAESAGKVILKNGTKPKVSYMFPEEKNQKKYLNIIKEFIKKV